MSPRLEPTSSNRFQCFEGGRHIDEKPGPFAKRQAKLESVPARAARPSCCPRYFELAGAGTRISVPEKERMGFSPMRTRPRMKMSLPPRRTISG